MIASLIDSLNCSSGAISDLCKHNEADWMIQVRWVSNGAGAESASLALEEITFYELMAYSFSSLSPFASKSQQAAHSMW